jgi:uncharacterized small protein (DUF1192 family)
MNTVYNNLKKAILFVFAIVAVSEVSAQSLSDNQIKKNVVTIDGPLQKIVQLKPTEFEYDTQKYKHLQLKSGKQFGFNAEEVQNVLPELVTEKNISFMYGKNSYRDAKIKTVDEASLIPLLVASIKELEQQIAQLKAEMQTVKSNKALSGVY